MPIKENNNNKKKKKSLLLSPITFVISFLSVPDSERLRRRESHVFFPLNAKDPSRVTVESLMITGWKKEYVGDRIPTNNQQPARTPKGRSVHVTL